MTKQEILQEIAKSRTAIGRDFLATKHSLDVKARLSASVRERPFAWLGGAAALGWVFAGRRRPKARVVPAERHPKGRQKEARAEQGWLAFVLGLLRLAMPVLKPALSAYAARRLAEMAAKVGR